MPSSLTYSLSGSEGGRSPGGLIDLDKSLVGVDLTTTPGTTPVKGKSIASATLLAENKCHASVQDTQLRGASGVAQRKSSRRGSDDVSYREDMARRVPIRASPIASRATANFNDTGDRLGGQGMDAASDEPNTAHGLVEDTLKVHHGEDVEAAGYGVRLKRAGEALQDNAEKAQSNPSGEGRDIVNLDEDATSRPDKTDLKETVPGAIGDLKKHTSSDTSYEGTPIDFDPTKLVNASPEVGIGEEHTHEPEDRCHSDKLNAEEEARLERRASETFHKDKEIEKWTLANPRDACALSDCAPSTIIQSQTPGKLLSMDKRQGFDADDFMSDTSNPRPTMGSASPLGVHDGDPLPKREGGRKAPEPTECYLDYIDGVAHVGAADGSIAKGQGLECEHSRITGYGTAPIMGIATVESGADVERHGIHSAHNAVSPDGVKSDENAEFTREPQSPPPLSRRSSRQLNDPHAENIHSHEQEEAVAVKGVSEDRSFSHKESLAFRAALDRPTTPQMPEKRKPASPQLSTPKLSPTIHTSPPESQTRHAISPRSPVAIAAHVLSHEESMRSTVHMRRAAKAIAFEDECKRLEIRGVERAVPQERLEQREDVLRKSSRHRRIEAASHARRRSIDHKRMDSDEGDERRRLRKSKANSSCRNDKPERDHALELTLEVLRRKAADNAEGWVTDHHRLTSGSRSLHSPSRRSRPPQTRLSELARRIKDPSARSCGLSTTQVVLLERSRELEKEKCTPRKADPQQTERLAQPKAKRPATRTRDPTTEALVNELTRGMNERDKRAFLYACLEDAKECTHSTHPRFLDRRRGGRRRNYDEEKKEHGAKDSFLYRMDAQERAKHAAMEHRRGELEYNATLDKRICSSCDAEQSYDEVREGRKICPNCDMEYRKPRTWATVRKDFMKRTKKFEESRRAYLEAATKQKERQVNRLKLRRHNAPNHEIGEQLFWEDIEDDFISRLQKDLAKRQASRERFAKAVGDDCTFHPTLSASSYTLVHGGAWAEMDFWERLEVDLQRRRDAALAAGGDDYSSTYKHTHDA